MQAGDKIRLFESQGILLHFKYLRANLLAFFYDRIEDSEHWNDSIEYIHYRNTLLDNPGLTFYHQDFSKELCDLNDIRTFFAYESER